jgi:ribose 5-phosphate isomerase B
MRIHLATDHAGLELLRDLAEHLDSLGHEVVDHGPQSFDALDDYPGFCIKVPGVRAALIWNRETAVLAREHNDANVAAIGARQHGFDEAVMLIEAFVATPFSGDERHARRIGQIRHFEHTGHIPASGQTF